MYIARKLFVVPMAENNRGKTTMINALLSQGLGAASPARKGQRELVSPFGRKIDAYVFVRSFQETEKTDHETVERALEGNDPGWRTRELIIFPSHAEIHDTEDMIAVAHSAGFDAICAAVILRGHDRTDYADIWQLNWDERWTIPNDFIEGQNQWSHRCEALGRDLWAWVCRALAS